MDYNQIDEIANRYGTPYYIMHSEAFISNIMAFKKAFNQRYNKVIIAYSFKTNYVPALCNIAKGIGCYAEVVSEMEYSLAKYLGYENIIFNGPIKKEAAIINALKDKAIINIDSLYELETVIKYKEENPIENVEVGLRLNIDLTNDEGISKIQCGLRVGRFGFTYSMLRDVIPLLHEKGIKIISLHGHTSSSDRGVENYGLIVSQMLNLCESLNLNDIRYFDIGGGFFGASTNKMSSKNKPRYDDYANQILDICYSSDWFNNMKPSIVIEPGVSVVANVFSYVSKIFQVKDISGQKFLTTDGSVFEVKPTFHKNNLQYRFYTKKDNIKTYTGNLVGSTCMEKDIILNNIDIPTNTKYGDYIKIDGVGAYTISLTPTFINYLSPIITISNNETNIIRRRQTIDDVLNLYTII